MTRIGPPVGRLALVGGSISFEDERPANAPVVVTDSSLLPDTSTALINRYTNHQTARLNFLWGLRNVRFVRASGFDALEGIQDLRTGVQVATLIGKGARILRGKERDLFGSTDLYAGMATPISYSAISIAGEGRRDEDGKWDGLLAHGRGAIYLKPFNRQTWMSDLTYSAGWKQRIPFQLTFADRDGGLRGFRTADVGGARGGGPLSRGSIQADRDDCGRRFRGRWKDLGGRFSVRREYAGLRVHRLQYSGGVASTIPPLSAGGLCISGQG